jgi:type IV pilus assembly protein PilY1
VTIPQGSTIRNAYIRFDVDQATRTGDTQLEIVAHDADDVAAGDIDSAAEITGASVTAAVDWPDVEGFYTGNQYDTPDITSILNTVVNRGSWSSGNAVCIQVRDNGSSLNHNRYVNSWDYTSGSGDIPKLIVDWLAP